LYAAFGQIRPDFNHSGSYNLVPYFVSFAALNELFAFGTVFSIPPWKQ
jgi:hypothetical protein